MSKVDKDDDYHDAEVFGAQAQIAQDAKDMANRKSIKSSNKRTASLYKLGLKKAKNVQKKLKKRLMRNMWGDSTN